MICVAITGLLAAIALPSYSKLTERAQVAAAKSHLAAAFMAEKNFFAEHSTYSSRLDAIGFDLDGVLNWTVGFANSGDLPPPADLPQGTATCRRTCYESGVAPTTFCTKASWTCSRIGSASGFNGPIAVSYARPTTFVMEAHAHLYGTPECISVYIDENNTIWFDPDPH